MTELLRQKYAILTPEGVSLNFEVATIGDRMAAFTLDLLVITAAVTLVLLLPLLAVPSQGGEAYGGFALLGVFLIWNFYFIVFEMRGGGRTFGKRRLSLRVISRDGGPLTADKILARNLLRNVEFALPLAVLLSPESLFSQSRGLGVLAGVAWIFIFALMPFFGKLRLRCGDLVAGTMVVLDPKVPLLPDIAASSARGPSLQVAPAADGAEESPYVFTSGQLEFYGIRELQVLEDLVRRHGEGRADRSVMKSVCDRITRKIGWRGQVPELEMMDFLRAFYKAQRGHLEQKLLFGQRKERKS